MIIQDNKPLRALQIEFHQFFPFLKIEFYEGRHASGEGSPIREQLDPNLTLGQVRKIHKKGDLKIDPAMTVADFEQQFADQYGLNVQVFRKSGNLWIQTTATDGWTLDTQNRKGGHSQEQFIEKYGR